MISRDCPLQSRSKEDSREEIIYSSGDEDTLEKSIKY